MLLLLQTGLWCAPLGHCFENLLPIWQLSCYRLTCLWHPQFSSQQTGLMDLSLGSCVGADTWQVEWARYRLLFSSSRFCTSPVFRAVCHLSTVSNLNGVHRLQTTMDAVVGTVDIFNIKILASFSLFLSTGSNFCYFPFLLSLTSFHITYQAKSECLLYCHWESNTAGLWKSYSICNFKMPKTSWKCKAAVTFPAP